MAITKNHSIRTKTGLRRAVLETLESRQLLSATPFYTTPFGTNQIIPAAAYDKGGAGVAYFDTATTNLGNDTFRSPDTVGISTGGLIGHVVSFTQQGEYLIYSLAIPVTGMYSVQSSSANTEAGGFFHVDFNGVNMTGDFSNYDTGSFTKYQTQQSAPFQLTAGNYLMKVYVDAVAPDGAGGNLNWFDVIATPAFPSGTEQPFSTPPGSGVKIPFVNYDKGGEGVAYHDTTPLNYGNSDYRNNTSVDISSGGTSGNIVGYTAPTEYLNYTIDLPNGGTYSLQASSANTASGGLFHLSEGGINLTGEIPIAQTTSYTTYATDTSPVFKLPAGKQVIRIAFDKAATNGACGNFDFFTLVPTAPPAELPFTTPFAANQTIPAANYDKGGQGVGYFVTNATNLGNDPTYRPGDAVSTSTGGTTGVVVGHTAPTDYYNYTLDIATAGQYQLVANTANNGTGGTFQADVGGVNLTGPITAADTMSYTTYAKDTSGPFMLAAGKQVLSIIMDKDASNGAIGNFDYFKIIPFVAPADTPFKTAFVANEVIPAANFDNGGQGVSYNVPYVTNPGTDTYRSGTAVGIKAGGTTGNLIAYTTAGEWLQYTVNITTAGNYKLEASVANPAAGATFHIALNGANLTSPTAITPTAGFTTFATDTTASFALTAGTHILRVFFDTAASNGAVGNFDYFKLVPA